MGSPLFAGPKRDDRRWVGSSHYESVLCAVLAMKRRQSRLVSPIQNVTGDGVCAALREGARWHVAARRWKSAGGV